MDGQGDICLPVRLNNTGKVWSSMENRLELQQKQTISQQMVPALNILQMNTLALKEYVESFALENPLVDLDAMLASSYADPDDHAAAGKTKAAKHAHKAEWLASLDEQNRAYYLYEYDDDSRSDPLDAIPDPKGGTLSDHILLQILCSPDFDYDRKVIDYLCSCLDSRGFFTDTEEDTAHVLHLPAAEVHRYLSYLKELEPAGVFSSCTEECLIRQLFHMAFPGPFPRISKAGVPESSPASVLNALADVPYTDLPVPGFEVEKEIILSCPDLLADRRFDAIARKLHIKKERVTRAASLIKSLDPVPSRGFAGSEPVHYTTPDITVVKFTDRFEILVNDYTCPSITLNPEYLKLSKENCSPEAYAYLREKKQQVLQLQDQIRLRSRTLLRLAECIVEAQTEFFLNGNKNLKPFSRSQAAELLSVHESTISRTLKDKYLQCCYGIYPLDFFFSRNFPADDPAASVSVSDICEKIALLIQKENKKQPLRDEELCLILNKEGIPISRRTVAKYRDQMGLPVWRLRKEI